MAMEIPLSAASALAIPPLTSPSAASVAGVMTPMGNGSEKSTGPGGEEETEETNEEQLSRDLALFLANPSLQAALADGSLDLASYSSTVEQELHELESQCIQVYRRKENEITTLRTELADCDAVLSALQEMLLGFQADLGGLSGEIRSIQDKSRVLAVQYGNRKLAEDGLGQFLSHIVIAPNLAQAITSGPINRVFVEAVREMNTIYQNVHDTKPQPWSANKPPSQTTAGKEMQIHVYKLRCVAVTRVRDYFLTQMALLRRPQTNVRMIQVHGLLQYAYLQDFLTEANPQIAQEIFNVYIESMSKTLYTLFRTYQTQLLQLDATRSAATRQDVIAIDDAALRDSLTTKAKKRVDVFALGTRAQEVLFPSDAPDYERKYGRHPHQHTQALPQPILAHVALMEKKLYPYERLFRSIMGHLLEAVTNEHVFCRQLFKRDAFGPLFSGTLSDLQEQLENYLFGCHDALALLLMIKVVHQYRRVAKQRTIHSLDGFYEKVNQLLWPRLKMIMDSHRRSIKGANALKLGGVDLHAHYVSRRFAEFACSVLLILKDGNNTGSTAAASRPKGQHRHHHHHHHKGGKSSGKSDGGKHQQHDDRKPAATPSKGRSRPANLDNSGGGGGGRSAGDMLLQDVSEMLDEYLLLLDRLADEHTSQKRRIVFEINNLDHVVCIFQERRVVGKEFNRLVEKLMAQRELFVEEELLVGFSKMIAFVQQTEGHINSAPTGSSYNVNPSVVQSLVREFSSNWKANIELINRNVLSYFSNFRNGMEILKQVLTQLLLYYTRFQDIIRKVWQNKPPAFCKDLVSTSLILAEIKKYALAI
ncbi:protein sorting-associated protein 52 homolog [Seminavis robusta]|uniref:Protein sorting-associated protein 52 homolog n=1 Tax=Seminavis robusta TaxID=568900 RepID=A0A9N8DRJ9_9STRA|nr:protein sorting-associated protein 52 homolog [Seminavis robusta]|eukprot:Sro301_g111960.1 protein sorting-associated protein 52 homolog (818) ;mRNA; r:42234-44687